MANTNKVAIIGAGSSGIAACKVLKQHGVPFDCFEAGDRVGGNWVYGNSNGMSSAYRHCISIRHVQKCSIQTFPCRRTILTFPITLRLPNILISTRSISGSSPIYVFAPK